MTEVTELAVRSAKFASQRVDESGAGSLFHDGQHIASVDGSSSGDDDFLNNSFFWRLDFVLHLHRFDNSDALPCFALRLLGDEQTHDASGHRSDDPSRTFFVLRAGLAGTQGS